MAFALVQTKFLFALDLKYGVWLYGLIMFLMSCYYISYPVLNVQDWIVFITITCPGSILSAMLIFDGDNFGYAYANWYFSFFAYIFATVYIVMQTLMLQGMKASVGSGSIHFRINEMGNPLSPHLIGDAAYG